jgi:hypothetical protein
MSCDYNCAISFRLIPLGGTGCGIEYDRNEESFYSIGDQYISYSTPTGCPSCISIIKINEQTPPVFVNDGDEIIPRLITNPSCVICDELIECSTEPTFAFVRSNGRLFVRVSK